MTRPWAIPPVASLVTTVFVVTATMLAPPARAGGDDVAVNGVFTAFSNGIFAKTRDVSDYQDDVTSTWTITSTCTTFQDCTGTVSSSQGWTADLRLRAQVWRVTRTVVDWERCPDGSTAPGEQSFTFWPARGDAPDRHDRLGGWDETIGPSGACGVNAWLTVRMPFQLTRIR